MRERYDDVYLEFSKAFDIVSDNFLLSKLGYYEMAGWAMRLGKITVQVIRLSN